MDTIKGSTLGSLNLGGFGSNTTSFSTPTPVQSGSALAPEGNATKNAATLTTENKSSDKSTASIASSTQKPTAQSKAEGMAARFEDIYLRVSKDIEKVANMGKKLTDTTKNEGADTKTIAHLTNSSAKWELVDIKMFRELLDGLSKNVSEDYPNIENATQVVRLIIAETAKCNKKSLRTSFFKLISNAPIVVIKREETQGVLENNEDRTSNIADQRSLSEETKLELDLLEHRAAAFNTMIQSLELSVLERVRRSAFLEEDVLKRSLVSLSNYYSFNKKICEIQSEINTKQKKLGNLEEEVGHIRMMDSSRKALQNSNGFSCIDLSDSDEEEDMSDAILYTTKYIRRFNFFNTLYKSTGQRAPLSFKKQE
ncbi:hypothetical protein BY458DRAFT_548398 [Sporodiniella umbellata]|nr:hypothetical protein BY458DRAFT_548398 [Sporodiniella umbellata]